MQEYVALIRFWHYLQQTNSDEQLNDLMVKMIDIEEKVLAAFGLPVTLTNGQQFQFLGLKDEFDLNDIDVFLKDLEQQAIAYHNSTPNTDLELIKRAQDQYLYIDEVLPETSLKLKAEPYYVFVYEEYLLTRRVTPETFLEEIRNVAKNDLSMSLYKLSTMPDPCSSELYATLNEYNLLFLDPFLTYYPEFEKDQSKYLFQRLTVI